MGGVGRCVVCGSYMPVKYLKYFCFLLQSLNLLNFGLVYQDSQVSGMAQR